MTRVSLIWSYDNSYCLRLDIQIRLSSLHVAIRQKWRLFKSKKKACQALTWTICFQKRRTKNQQVKQCKWYTVNPVCKAVLWRVDRCKFTRDQSPCVSVQYILPLPWCINYFITLTPQDLQDSCMLNQNSLEVPKNLLYKKSLTNPILWHNRHKITGPLVQVNFTTAASRNKWFDPLFG